MELSLSKNIRKKISKVGNKLPDLLLANTLGHAILMLDNSGQVHSWNNSAQMLMGYSAREVLGQDYSIFFSKEKNLKNLPKKYLKLAREKGISKSEDKLKRKDGSFFWVSSTINTILNNKRKNIGFCLILHDITERKEVEWQKDEYIGIASHELKTPISSLSLYSELLLERLKLLDDKKALQILKDVDSQVKRLLNLVEDLLVVNEVERNKLILNRKPFDIKKVIKKVIYDFQGTTTTHRIIFKGNIKNMVHGDESRITQVVVNLIANGIKYSPRANKIVVSLKTTRNKGVVSVKDFGKGMSLKEQKNIFQPFFRVYSLQRGNIPGLGLGLYISKEIIKKHHERIWVESKKGVGSTFFFSLPAIR